MRVYKALLVVESHEVLDRAKDGTWEFQAGAEASAATDLEKEKRWADQVLDAILDGDAVWLNDGAKETLDVLSKNSDFRLEVITNSVLASDNFFTRAIIDRGMTPRFLLTPKLHN